MKQMTVWMWVALAVFLVVLIAVPAVGLPILVLGVIWLLLR